MSSKRITTFVCALALSMSVTAQELGSGQAQAIATVQELLILDAGTAANIERQRHLASNGRQQAPTIPAAQPTMSPAAEATHPPLTPAEKETPAPAVEETADRVAVLGIFGFGKLLRAEVSINDQRVLFQDGRPAPISGALDTGYKLVKLKTPCVVLANSAGTTTACINRLVEG
ncbi:hypothetical protein NJC40_00055 [Pseudomonas sp. 21LCFQ02]|uniref:hypothetical protein n=1 Tax=Pseudomonas sp. 21LCFQ02 TaxID=2957505 RepID=UPI00209B9E92|nr:hypothetical protein [Pseudomonas sp. 21LCFQ02]MCO8166175.1 hypothetical protein [Pseudomonas sp. 21LCFQ02]